MGSKISKAIPVLCCKCLGLNKSSSSNANMIGSEFHDNPQEIQTEVKEYSWDKRKKMDPSEYTFADLTSAQRIKRPGELNGQQFIIRNCTNSKIFLFDHTSSLTIDDCNDCIIVTGPVANSIFLRDSKNCTLMCASSQLRLRDCQNIFLFVACESDPIIESSVNIVVGPYYLSYKGINDHFSSANLSNSKATHWANIYDFTPNDNLETNWKRYDKELHDPHKFICPPMPIVEFEDLEMSLDKEKSFVAVVEHLL